MQLTWHRYKYLPYEKDFALREVKSLLDPVGICETGEAVYVDQPKNRNMASRLVYFASGSDKGAPLQQTQQSFLERVNGNGVKRQSTRYSAHGLHEYKGKFNPQAAKAILNIFNAQPGQVALDPFCGSGTTLVECAHLGIKSVGTDINPLAAFLANVKLQSLGLPADRLQADADLVLKKARLTKTKPEMVGGRGEYLNSWFADDYLSDIENLRLEIEGNGGECVSVLLAIASNLLRDYSLQEPADLRIRRRKSEYPKISFFDAFGLAAQAFSSRLSASQDVLGLIEQQSQAINIDCKKSSDNPALCPGSFDLALTSPPYATALPYIDTQRLSLVWLGLVPPANMAALEAELIGSRETRGQSKKVLLETLEKNVALLPESEAGFCLELQNALNEGDGFRRQVVPSLLYRYFSGMAESFSSVRKLVKPNSPFGLIVGGNHTVLGGTRFDIDTPAHLASLATSQGWQHVETVPLQTYKRYGLHANNATSSEALVILRART